MLRDILVKNTLGGNSMRKIFMLCITLLFISGFLAACGGGSDSGSSNLVKKIHLLSD